MQICYKHRNEYKVKLELLITREKLTVFICTLISQTFLALYIHKQLLLHNIFKQILHM